VAALLAQKEELRRQLSLSQETVQTLTTSLAESNAEAELFRRKFADLRLRMEALGLFENRGRWRRAGTNGCRNAVAFNERAGG